MPNTFKKIAIALACATATASAGQAGGFNRGTADTDILFEEGNFSMRAGAVIVSPRRGYDTITSPLLGGTVSGTDGNFSDSYVVPSAAFKLQLSERGSCAGTYTESFGAGATYGTQAITAGYADGTGTVSEGFTSNEFGLTCGANFQAGKGRVWLIGGVFAQDFKYAQTVEFAPLTPLAGSRATLAFNDEYRLGYRIGAAYEIPEIALRGQVIYRSAVDHTPNTSQGSFTTVAGVFPTFGNGTLPQSIEAKFQTGIAAGTLAFASVKWTDWSVLQTLNYTIVGPAPIGGARVLEYFWQDGWTVSGGLARQFNEMVAGSVSLTWDKGVSTTEDVHTDTWTVASGVSLKGERGTELRLGGAISYLAAGSVAADPTPLTPGTGNTFAYSVDGDWSYAVGANFKVNW
ncbi:long-chain fatty acid transporter [Oricola cellulosilytica]|uniref:Long-chain fatty acid transporter n=1 Tax=Oricola cellulosilytica TaxID=1429082 RepID=A0A4R0P9J7_9HYPH|nr:long-chain fatty acid transporter [Oricola cellulosilytica]TCD12338.1 long-chain fatty acid transporter [Oricola cellulosilytica]